MCCVFYRDGGDSQRRLGGQKVVLHHHPIAEQAAGGARCLALVRVGVNRVPALVEFEGSAGVAIAPDFTGTWQIDVVTIVMASHCNSPQNRFRCVGLGDDLHRLRIYRDQDRGNVVICHCFQPRQPVDLGGAAFQRFGDQHPAFGDHKTVVGGATALGILGQGNDLGGAGFGVDLGQQITRDGVHEAVAQHTGHSRPVEGLADDAHDDSPSFAQGGGVEFGHIGAVVLVDITAMDEQLVPLPGQDVVRFEIAA